MNKGLSGLLVTHNCEQFDYCYRESLNSLIETCDEVIVIDGSSTDGTRDVLAGYQGISVFDAPWNPISGTLGAWLADLYNLAKSRATKQYQIGLQADEVLHEIDYEYIRKLNGNYTLKRLNFWKDAQHFLPKGKVCSDRVFRIGSSKVKFVGDAEGMQPNIRRKHSDVCIFHYGFLRKTECVISKSISFEKEVFGAYNPLFDQMKTEGRRPFDEYYDNLIPYDGSHPKVAHPWLDDRGYDCGIAASRISKFIDPDWTGVEIGVFRGDSSKHLLRRCKFMHLIDPCAPYDRNPDTTIFSSEDQVRGRLNGFRDNYNFIRGMSHEVHEQVPMVDFVFIDGNHTFEYISRDIELYWPKVRSGGFLSGHDYGEGFPGVVSAVNNFADRNGLPIEHHEECWLIRKP